MRSTPTKHFVLTLHSSDATVDDRQRLAKLLNTIYLIINQVLFLEILAFHKINEITLIICPILFQFDLLCF